MRCNSSVNNNNNNTNSQYTYYIIGTNNQLKNISAFENSRKRIGQGFMSYSLPIYGSSAYTNRLHARYRHYSV